MERETDSRISDKMDCYTLPSFFDWRSRRSRTSSATSATRTTSSSATSAISISRTVFALTVALLVTTVQGRTAFEKLTDLDYVGESYYTIRNLSLYECQGWCREEPECVAASFSFDVNNAGPEPKQETVCLLQNGTQANNPSAKPAKKLNQYYMVKMSIRSDKVCKRPWNFERVPNSMIQGHDRALIFTSTKEACLAACLNERNFMCRSAEYNYVTLQCRLSDYDRRTAEASLQPVELVEAPGVDYFENLCLSSDTACEISRSYHSPKFGIPDTKVAVHVGVHFYVDKELLANSLQACRRACTIESEFLCRSFLFTGTPNGNDYNCKLYHLDHWTLADGIGAFLNSNTPLNIANGNRIGSYYENRCETGTYYQPTNRGKQPKSYNSAGTEDIVDTSDDTMLCKRVVTKDRRYITQITCYEKGSEGDGEKDKKALRLPVYAKQTSGGTLASLFNFARQGSGSGSTILPGGGDGGLGGLGGDGSGSDIGSGIPGATIGGIGGGIIGGQTGGSSGGSGSIGGGVGSDLDGSSDPFGPNGPNGIGGSTGGSIGGISTGGSSTGGLVGGISTSGILPGGSSTGGLDGAGGAGGLDPDFPDSDVNCDAAGTCYDVTVHCKDTRIVVNVNTNRAFSGRIYALGRSETCNVDVINSDSFRLDLTMGGQDCNTQSANGVFTNTVVVQRHSVVMTKTDKIYKVRCTYDTTSRNITFGMMPIRDPDMISITAAPEAPAPRISIVDQRGQEVETVRIGDRLTFKIEIPENTPYGIFARSCVAMAKDSRSTFPIIDDEGCPVDPTIFPRFTPEGNALVSVYEAFRFTESYGVIFQCNVKYCLGPCEPVNCQFGRENFDSWGRKKRDVWKRDAHQEYDENVQVIEEQEDSQHMRLSHEIIVLDYGDERSSPYELEKKVDKTLRKGNTTDFHVAPMDWSKTGEEVFVTPHGSGGDAEDCPAKSSVMALAVTCALLVILYACTVFCFCAKRSSSKSKVDKVMLEGRLGALGLHSATVRDYVR